MCAVLTFAATTRASYPEEQFRSRGAVTCRPASVARRAGRGVHIQPRYRAWRVWILGRSSALRAQAPHRRGCASAERQSILGCPSVPAVPSNCSFSSNLGKLKAAKRQNGACTVIVASQKLVGHLRARRLQQMRALPDCLICGAGWHVPTPSRRPHVAQAWLLGTAGTKFSVRFTWYCARAH